MSFLDYDHKCSSIISLKISTIITDPCFLEKIMHRLTSNSTVLSLVNLKAPARPSKWFSNGLYARLVSMFVVPFCPAYPC